MACPRALAAQINRQLRALRRERLRLQAGNDALADAVTDISHDLRTPLTAVCGYLDLLEQEPQSERARRYLAILRERTDAMCDIVKNAPQGRGVQLPHHCLLRHLDVRFSGSF